MMTINLPFLKILIYTSKSYDFCIKRDAIVKNQCMKAYINDIAGMSVGMAPFILKRVIFFQSRA